ncbi:MAG TPA: hypothetical protein VH369_03250 [Bryobacteraceae bacterium]|jgi:hypothetical protein
MRIRPKQLGLSLAAVALLSVATLFAVNSRDTMFVHFTHPVHVQGDVLAPGQYTIETMSGAEANNNVLEVYGKNNRHFKTTFTTIGDKKIGGADTTHVTLLKIGGNYYLDKIFIQGRVHGYQVLLPEDIRNAAQNAQSEDLTATLQ